MRRTWAIAIIAALVAGVQAASPPAAAGQVCGTTDPETDEVHRGSLTLDEENAVTDRVFRRDTDPRTLALIFAVGECRLAPDAPDPRLQVTPRQGAEELPAEAVSLREVIPDGSALDVLVEVDGAGFDPGSYGALLVLRSPHLLTTRTPVAVSRSENRWVVPALIGALAALAGFFLFSLVQHVRGARLSLPPIWLVPVGLIAAAVGAVLVLINYFNQDVWTFGENAWAAAATGFGGATSGVMAGLLGGMWGASPRHGGGRRQD